MTVPTEGNALLAVLIDADNADSSIIDGLLAEVSTLGVASVKRIYGDWTNTRLNKWKDTLLAHSIQPIQQFAYTTGKNATDSAMIIDAMDLLHAGEFDGFCLVSSDSDFTRLASRLRESGKRVYGFGERKTPEAFVKACDQFIYNEIFRSAPVSDDDSRTRVPGGDLRQDRALLSLIRSAINAASDDNGRAPLGQVGNIILKQRPDFDPRNYGYAKLSGLIDAIGLFTVSRQEGAVLISDTKPDSKSESKSGGKGEAKSPAKKSSRRPAKKAASAS
ncbi:uncharacterized LabA/DUF88 family protein [Marmoricola sp. URHA0025 HA25]